MSNPYVISAELDLAESETVNSRAIEGFREELDTDLRKMGKDTLWIPSEEIRTYLNRAISYTNVPVLSLDDRYLTSPGFTLGVSRGVNTCLLDEGYVPRVSYPAITMQLDRVSADTREVVVVDDVLFSGEMLTWLVHALDKRGVKVRGVICGLAIQEGIDKLKLQDIAIESGIVFETVEDEICERDFAFVPGSGRRIAALNANALYFDSKFGRPDKWASIPPAETSGFCLRSLERNLRLLRSDAPIRAIGQFLGYANDGIAVDLLQQRIEEGEIV